MKAEINIHVFWIFTNFREISYKVVVYYYLLAHSIVSINLKQSDFVLKRTYMDVITFSLHFLWRKMNYTPRCKPAMNNIFLHILNML